MAFCMVPIRICGWLLIVLSLVPPYAPSVAPISGLMSPSNYSGCSCPGEVLTYACTAEGFGSTLWNGSAFNCPGNEIVLLHRLFSDGTSGDCNNGDILARSLRVDRNYYISQLNVTISAQLHNKSVGCLVRMTNGMTVRIGISPLITVGSVLYWQAPYQVRLTDVNTSALTISWTPVESICSFVSYNIISDQCGTCNVTSESRAVCANFRLPSVCNFSIQYVVCGQAGAASNPISVNLAVPNRPTVRKITPVYSADLNSLVRFILSIDQEDPFNITDDTSGSVTSYSVEYSGTTSTINDTTSSCVQGVCELSVNVSSSLCEGIGNIIVGLSASNIVGLGPPLNFTVGCFNDFVEVKYDSTVSSITCQFLNQTDTSIKSCSVMYGQCGMMLKYTQESNSTVEVPNIVSLTLHSDKFECYVVIARSDAMTVIIEAKTIRNGNLPREMNVLLVLILLPAITAIAVIIVTVVVLIAYFWKKDVIRRKKLRESDEHLQMSGGYQVNKTDGDVTDVDQKAQTDDNVADYVIIEGSEEEGQTDLHQVTGQ